MRPIKRLAGVLAAVLIATQVITVMPVYAEEVVQEGQNEGESQTKIQSTNMCSHVKCGKYVSGYTGASCSDCQTNASFTSNGDGSTHTYRITCEKCGEVANGTEQCVAENGMCKFCGQAINEEKCCHKECNNYSDTSITYCSKCSFRQTGFNSNNDGYTHTTSFDCPGCANSGTQINDCYFVDGKCRDCGQDQKFTICMHPNCERPVAPGITRCEICAQSWEITTYWIPAGEYVHHVCVYYPCCQSTNQGDELHSFNSEGKCKCGYIKSSNTESGQNTNENTNKNETINQSETIVDNSSESNNQNDNVVEKVKTVSVTSGGKVFTSSVSSVYASNAVNGAVVATPKQLVNEAMGIQDGNENASFFVCNNKDAKRLEQMNEQAQKNGKALYNIFNSDLYKITKNGVVEKMHETEKPVTLMFALPFALQNKKVSIIAYNNKTGEYVEFEDTDSDPKTITIDATVFGVYALVVME